MKNALIIFVLAAVCFSCKKAEMPVPKHNPGNVTMASANMDATYKWQIYYSLENNAVVSQNLKTTWDLGFEAYAEGGHVILNMSKFMFARNMGATTFTAVSDTNGFGAHRTWDAPSGNLDSTAIGNWQNSNPVYVIDRGFDENGAHLGFRKIQILAMDANNYTVRLAQLNGSGDTTLTLRKDSACNFTFFSFNANRTVSVEPPKTAWDIVFTQYTHIFYNPAMPYLVTGCLLNRYNTRAVMDSSVTFGTINLSYASGKSLSSANNVIGYEWKEYSFNTSSYTIYPQMNYILQNSAGMLFKLHFTGFYTASGVKGDTQWEYQKL